MARRNRVDRNQKEIVRFLESFDNVSVRKTDQVGEGFPDLTVHAFGLSALVEVKMPKKKLSPKQRKFFKQHENGFLCTVRSESDAARDIVVLGSIFALVIGLPFMFDQEWSMQNIALILGLGVFQLGISFGFYISAIQYLTTVEI